MKLVEIDGKDYNLPSSWNEVSIGKFEKVAELSELILNYKSDLLFSIEIFSILLDAPIEIIKKLDRNSYEVLNKELDWINKEIPEGVKDKFEIDGTIYIPYPDMSKMSMGESIDLELAIKDSNKINLLGNILPYIIRKAIPEIGKDGETILKPGPVENVEKTKQLFKEKLMIADVVFLKSFF